MTPRTLQYRLRHWAAAREKYPHLDGQLLRQVATRLDNLEEQIRTVREQRDSARHLAFHLFQMIDEDTWRDCGGDDGQGHYEGLYRAARIEEEIRSWKTLQAPA
jgi:hypothetical protein